VIAKQIPSDKEVSPRLLLLSLGDLGGKARHKLVPLLFGIGDSRRPKAGKYGSAQDNGGHPSCTLDLLLRPPDTILLRGHYITITFLGLQRSEWQWSRN
jgi:hypothetical protein